MKPYLSLFKIRFIYGLQYRMAAAAAISTQFAWGALTLLMFSAFYRHNPAAIPLTPAQLANYIWLQQAFLALFMSWFFDGEILESITSGSIAYELCRPFDLYKAWFVKNAAVRLSRAVLRSMPILAVAIFLPEPYNLTPPANAASALLFIPSLCLGVLVLISFSMLIYISAFYTLSPRGTIIIAVTVTDFCSGAVIPLPFYPAALQKILSALPFAAMQNTPLLLYAGAIQGKDAAFSTGSQLFWLISLILTGKVLMKSAIKRTVIHGG